MKWQEGLRTLGLIVTIVLGLHFLIVGIAGGTGLAPYLGPLVTTPGAVILGALALGYVAVNEKVIK